MNSPDENAAENSAEDQQISAEDVLRCAMDLHQKGHLLEARELYEKLHQFDPRQPDVLHFLGVISHQLGETEKAIGLVEQAVEQDPKHPDMRSNLGNLLVAADRLQEAETQFRESLRLRPRHPQAHNNLGVVLKRTDRLADAESEFRKAIALAPDHPDAHDNLARILERTERNEEAVEHDRIVYKLKSKNVEILANLSRTLRKAGQLEQAAEVVRQWLALAPDDPTALHTLAALTGDASLDHASEAYIESYFEKFASDFDAVLNELGYQGPDRLRQTLETIYPQRGQSDLRVLELGCGTGLCGPVVRGYARRLVGVDISQPMLDQAEKKGNYDQLICQEMVAYLDACTESFDLVFAADTFIYLRTLDEVLAGIERRLTPQGHLIFTVERGDGTDAALRPTGRFVHGRDYLYPICESLGMPIATCDDFVLRHECSEPQHGMIIVAQKR